VFPVLFLTGALIVTALGALAWAGVWRYWVATPIGRIALGLAPIGLGLTLIGIGILTGLRPLTLLGVVSLFLALFVTIFLVDWITPAWYFRLPASVRRPPSARTQEASSDGEEQPDARLGDGEAVVLTSRAQYVEQDRPPVLVLGFSTTARSGYLSLYPTGVVFRQGSAETALRGRPFALVVPLQQIQDAEVLPSSLMEALRATDIGAMSAKRKRLRITVDSRSFVFVVRDPERWVNALRRLMPTPDPSTSV
jgi:hypothetical protein